MKTIAVFAGHDRQFYHYLEQHVLPLAKAVAVYSSGKAVIDNVRYIYVGDVDRALRGLRNYEIVFYGTWLDRSSYDRDLAFEFKNREKL